MYLSSLFNDLWLYVWSYWWPDWLIALLCPHKSEAFHSSVFDNTVIDNTVIDKSETNDLYLVLVRPPKALPLGLVCWQKHAYRTKLGIRSPNWDSIWGSSGLGVFHAQVSCHWSERSVPWSGPSEGQLGLKPGLTRAVVVRESLAVKNILTYA